jgi:hypothetical protein
MEKFEIILSIICFVFILYVFIRIESLHLYNKELQNDFDDFRNKSAKVDLFFLEKLEVIPTMRSEIQEKLDFKVKDIKDIIEVMNVKDKEISRLQSLLNKKNIQLQKAKK